ncbi:MAG: hypothetical protein OEY01_13055 [Desulfobulbaceae bacterium]|nr:hypothetical protein [Desulfobulbaceae bacterium]HIJ79658.1 hypothetical protein [Deltaproteobacteria bacterium]
MFLRGFLLFGALLLSAVTASAGVITITEEPQLLIDLRKAYVAEQANAVMPEDIARAELEYEEAKKKAITVDSYKAKRMAIEKAREKEFAVIKARYQKELAKLEQGTLAAVDKEYQQKNAALKEREVGKVHENYLKKLEKLEKDLIGQSDLAGALVVQTERKKMSLIDPTKPVAAAPAPVVDAPKAEAAPVVAPEKDWQTQDNKIHISSVRGVAGSEGNVANNVYPFRLEKLGQNAKLVFYGYGNRSDNSYGEVYLITPDGNRNEVASWSPNKLQGPKFSEVKSYSDVQPIDADISSYVKQAGLYKVEFLYRDGDEALNIYRVELQTW